MLTIVPSTTWTSRPQPTEQYWQTLGKALASLMRISAARATLGCRSAPNAVRAPIVVAAPAPLTKARRETVVTAIGTSSSSVGPAGAGGSRVSGWVSSPPVRRPGPFGAEVVGVE